MELRIREAPGVLYAAAAGELDLPRAITMYQRLISRWRTGEPMPIVIDCRPLRGTLTDMQRYEIGLQVAASYAPIRESGRTPPRIAMVALPPLIEPRRFIQTVASNRGALIGAFESLREAAEWLGLDPAELEAIATSPEVDRDGGDGDSR
jgi:hypothetical protein